MFISVHHERIVFLPTKLRYHRNVSQAQKSDNSRFAPRIGKKHRFIAVQQRDIPTETLPEIRIARYVKLLTAKKVRREINPLPSAEIPEQRRSVLRRVAVKYRKPHTDSGALLVGRSELSGNQCNRIARPAGGYPYNPIEK
jgi:hypothetical protein